MPWSSQQVWIDEKEGPNAFENVVLLNQDIWDCHPDHADGAICEALARGGFGEDLIQRRVGNYEGQIMAIRRGFVDKQNYGYRINDLGQSFLRLHGKLVAKFLPATDSWHRKDSEYCMYEVTYDGEPALQFAKELIAQGQTLCMCPLFRRRDAEALRDYLSDWLNRI